MDKLLSEGSADFNLYKSIKNSVVLHFDENKRDCTHRCRRVDQLKCVEIILLPAADQLSVHACTERRGRISDDYVDSHDVKL